MPNWGVNSWVLRSNVCIYWERVVAINRIIDGPALGILKIPNRRNMGWFISDDEKGQENRCGMTLLDRRITGLRRTPEKRRNVPTFYANCIAALNAAHLSLSSSVGTRAAY